MDIFFHYPPELLNLLKDVIPKLCKSKKNLLDFFQGAALDQELLKPYRQLLEVNKEGFNKYHVTAELLIKLNELGEKSLAERRNVLRRVTETEDFSGCWETDRAAAVGLVAQIQKIVNVKDSFTRMQQEKDGEQKRRIAEKEAVRAIAAVRTAKIEKVKAELFGLFGASDAHKRGKDLERAMNALFAAYDFVTREAFTVKGVSSEGVVEQIDGLVEIDGMLYLVELKWWTKPIGTAEVSPHLVRVYGRGGQARGIFISYSEFTAPAITTCREALTGGAVIALCTLQEIVRLLESSTHLQVMLKSKINAAIADKKPYLPWSPA
jgi:hypothetical protein